MATQKFIAWNSSGKEVRTQLVANPYDVTVGIKKQVPAIALGEVYYIPAMSMHDIPL